MILGKIVGKVTTKHFQFEVASSADAKNFEYIQVVKATADGSTFVLCQIVELVRDSQTEVARCVVLGYKDEDGMIKQLREPFHVGSEVLRAEDEFIKSIVKLESSQKGALIGKLDGRDINIYLDLQNLLTKHVAILAKSGAGKSYSVGVLLEEIMEKHVPLLIIDPHGEYATLREKNENPTDVARLAAYGLKPKAFLRRVQVYGDINHNPDVKPITISDKLEPQELFHVLPSKLSAAQEGIVFSALKRVTDFDFQSLIFALEQEESPAKWNVIKLIEYLRSCGFFSKAPIPLNELVQGGKCSVINLRGIAPDMQQILVYKLLKDLFEARKKQQIPPFFCVIEEAHNFCPERSFGAAITSDIIRTLASEGRKFGLGICVVSQRPARVDKSVLSQVSTQLILKVTNPNDLKAISNSVEGLTADSENEIQNLSIGQALITGVVDVPLFVTVRPRMTKHGGSTVDILENFANEKEFFGEIEEFDKKNLLPIVLPKISKKDFMIINDGNEQNTKTVLLPCVMFLCQTTNSSNQFNLLFERVNGCLIKDVDTRTIARLPELDQLTEQELLVLKKAFTLRRFDVRMLQAQGFGLDVGTVLDALVEKSYLALSKSESETGGTVVEYKIDETYILSNLKAQQIYDRIEYRQIKFDEKVSPIHTTDSIKTKLAKFVTIKDLRDCFLVSYVVNK